MEESISETQRWQGKEIICTFKSNLFLETILVIFFFFDFVLDVRKNNSVLITLQL